jgi:hypothetical protein
MQFPFSTPCGEVRESSASRGYPSLALVARGLFSLVPLIGLALIIAQSLRLIGFEGQIFNHGTPTEIQEIKGDRIIGQTFVAPLPGLDRIDVLLFDRGHHNTQPVTFHLRQGVDGSEDLLSISFNASEVRGESWHTFTFSAMPDSGGKAYYFYFSSPDSSTGNAIAVGGVEGNLYSRGTAYLYSTPTNADLAFRTYYSDITLSQKVEKLAERLTEHKPFVLGNIYFYVFLALVYVIFVTALSWQITGLVIDWRHKQN